MEVRKIWRSSLVKVTSMCYSASESYCFILKTKFSLASLSQMRSHVKAILHSSQSSHPAGSAAVLWHRTKYIPTHYLSCLQLCRSKVPNPVTLDQTYFMQFLVPYAWSHSKMFPCSITIQRDFFLKVELKILFLVGQGKL